EPPAPDVFRSRFLLVAKFAAELPAHVVANAIAERHKYLREELDHLEQVANEDWDDPASRWLIEYGRTCLATSLKHLETHGDDLVSLAEPTTAEAAQ
ncbi:MAG: PadR family transcriptional regulator, partial [Pseudomonadota bacterium]